MSATKDGGPAFPYAVQKLHDSFATAVRGMTLRDWFAGQALEKAARGSKFTAEEIATRAYYIADAMLAAREGGAE